MRKLSRIISRESTNDSMNETLTNFLHFGRKLEGKEEKERRYHQVRPSIKKLFRRSSSQVHRDNTTVWQNHRMIKAAIKKKMMALPAKFTRSPG